MVSEMCGYDMTLICLKNRRCLTCHIYLKRTKEFDERLTEAQIREKVWEIIDEEIETHIGAIYRARDRDVKEHLKAQIKSRIQELLNKHEAILVYQP